MPEANEPTTSTESTKSSSDVCRYQVLLEVAGLLGGNPTLQDILPTLEDCLKRSVNCDYLALGVRQDHRQVVQLHHRPELAPPLPEVPLDDSVSGEVLRTGEVFLSSDLPSGAQHPDILSPARRLGLRSLCVVPMGPDERRVGTLAVGSSVTDAYSSEDIRFLTAIANCLALVTENVISRETLDKQTARLEMLLDIKHAFLSNLDVKVLFPALSKCMERVFAQQYSGVTLYDSGSDSLLMYALEFESASASVLVVPDKSGPAGRAFVRNATFIFRHEDLAASPSKFISQLLEQGIRSLACIPLRTAKGVLGTLNLGSKTPDAFDNEKVSLLEHVAADVAAALDNARTYKQLQELRERLSVAKTAGAEVTAPVGHGIVGESRVLKQVLQQVNTVAASGATVLILGETGTGKELIAHALHANSERRNEAFVKMNCAAIPTGLLESELFGHEKGAFTGAVTMKIGRLELADKGTLFLDEVGDIPLELQPKLLRVLQDQEFERLGGTRTIRVNVRLLAATNKDLPRSVSQGEFRSDLYYRLHVFPVRMPALRDRPEDIPPLVRHFLRKIGCRLRKKVEVVPDHVMHALMRWPWPGNVRELENFIERSMILSDGEVLAAPLDEISPESALTQAKPDTLECVERQQIIRVLRETGGVLGGEDGAASRLGMKRTTLQSRMHKLGISRIDFMN